MSYDTYDILAKRMFKNKQAREIEQESGTPLLMRRIMSGRGYVDFLKTLNRQTIYTGQHTPDNIHLTTYSGQHTPDNIHRTTYTGQHTPENIHRTTYTGQHTPDNIQQTHRSAYRVCPRLKN
jgi:hypothetical protein